MRKTGFTLAEVLLTLTIIGVVAAMTVPNLMGAVEDKELAAQAKKAYNTLQNAVSMHYAMTRMTPADYTRWNLLEKISPNLKYVRASNISGVVSTSGSLRFFELPDGQIMTTPNVGEYSCDTDNPSTACYVVVDVNGVDGPTFSSITRNEKNAAGIDLTQLTRATPPTSKREYNRASRDIVFFMVNGLSVTPWMNDGTTRRYFSGKK